MKSLKDKKAVAQYVENTAANLELGSQLIMSMYRAKSGDFYVHTATVELLDDTEGELEMYYSTRPGNISPVGTLVG